MNGIDRMKEKSKQAALFYTWASNMGNGKHWQLPLQHVLKLLTVG